MARAGAVLVAASALAISAFTSSNAARSRSSADVDDPPAPVAMRCVDVNAAGGDELALLPGIGPSIARRIVEDRLERGPYASADDLRRVKGIGPTLVERVRPFVTAGQPS
jgi:competence protein ComEA